MLITRKFLNENKRERIIFNEDASIKLDDSSDLTKDPQKAADSWPDTFYKGFNIFEWYVRDDVSDKFRTHIFDQLDARDGQESYLGYSPSKDCFVTGWDLWNENESGYGFAEFKVEEESQLPGINKIDGLFGEKTFYMKGLKYVRSLYPDIIDVRLD